MISACGILRLSTNPGVSAPIRLEQRRFAPCSTSVTGSHHYWLLTDQIRQQLWRYYPQFLELKADLSAAWVLALWDRAPTPKRACRIRVPTVVKLLKKHRIRRFTARQVIDILRSKPLTVPEGVTGSATSYIGSLVRRVDLVREELTAVEQKIQAILDSLKARAEPAILNLGRSVGDRILFCGRLRARGL